MCLCRRWWVKQGLTFSIAGNLQLPYHRYRHGPNYDILENAPGAVKDVHHNEIDTSHGVVEYLGYVPIIRNGVALKDVPLRVVSVESTANSDGGLTKMVAVECATTMHMAT